MQQTKATKKDIVHAETQTLISSREVEATTEIPIFDNVTYNHDSPIVSGPPNYNSSYQAAVCIFSNSSDSSECYQYDIINEETSHSDPNPINQPSVASSQEARCVFSSSSDSSECYEWQTVDENVFPDPSLINNAPSTGSNEIAVCVFINSSNSNCYHWNVYDEKIEYTAPNPENRPSTNSDEEAICVYEDRNNSSKCYDYIRVTEQSTYSAPSTASAPSTNSDEIAVCVFENNSGSECYAYQKANKTTRPQKDGAGASNGTTAVSCILRDSVIDNNGIFPCYQTRTINVDSASSTIKDNSCPLNSNGEKGEEERFSGIYYCSYPVAESDLITSSTYTYNISCYYRSDGSNGGEVGACYEWQIDSVTCASDLKTVPSGGNNYCLDYYAQANIDFEKYDYICVDGSNFYCYKWEYRYSRTIECSSSQHTETISGEDYCLDTRSRPNTTQGSTSCEEGSTNNCYIWEFSKYNDQLCNNDQHDETLSNGRTYCLEDFDLDTVNNNNETYWDTRCESGSTRNNDCLRWEYLSTKTASCPSGQYAKDILGREYCFEPFSQPDTVRWSTSCRSGFSESGVCLWWDFITNNSVVCSSSQYGIDVNSNGKIYCQNAISQTDIDTRNEWNTQCESGSLQSNNDCLLWEYFSSKTYTRNEQVDTTIDRFTITVPIYDNPYRPILGNNPTTTGNTQIISSLIKNHSETNLGLKFHILSVAKKGYKGFNAFLGVGVVRINTELESKIDERTTTYKGNGQGIYRELGIKYNFEKFGFGYYYRESSAPFKLKGDGYTTEEIDWGGITTGFVINKTW